MTFILFCLLLFAPIEHPKPADATPEEETAQQLAKVRRIYISVLTGGDAALQIRDLLMTSLQRSKQFIITEDEDSQQQAMIFKVDKDAVRAILVSLEARTGRKVEFQDDDARKGGKG